MKVVFLVQTETDTLRIETTACADEYTGSRVVGFLQKQNIESFLSLLEKPQFRAYRVVVSFDDLAKANYILFQLRERGVLYRNGNKLDVWDTHME